MTRGGRTNDQDEPERKCLATGEVSPKSGLIRFVLGPDDLVVPDIAAKLPGRGMYVSASREAIERAVKKNLFTRAARQPVKLPDGLADLIESLLARRVVDLLSMSRKASSAVMGYEKVKEWLQKGRAVVLIQAEDGSERGKTKLRPPGGENSLISCLTAGEIGLAFGRERAIHAALGAGGLTTRVVEEAARLAGLRIGSDQHDGGKPAEKDTKDA